MLSKITSWRHSKVLAFVLAVAVFLTAFYGLTPVISRAEATGEPISDPTKVDIWNGVMPATLAEAFGTQCDEDDIGTEGNPYEITTGAQLYAAVHSGTEGSGKYFVLLKDIQLQTNENLAALRQFIADTKGNTTTTALPSGLELQEWDSNGTKEFHGIIDGNFHTVTGLYRDGAESGGSAGHGFIDKLQGTAVVKNFIFDASYITGNQYVGGVAGVLYQTAGNTRTISGCTVMNSKLENRQGKNSYTSSVGGIFGCSYVGGFLIENCVVTQTEITNFGAYAKGCAGITGDFWSGTERIIRNCISTDYSIGSNSSLTAASNLYAASKKFTQTTVLTDAMKGATAYDIMNLTPAKGWVVLADNAYPMYVGAENVANYDYLTPVWNGKTSLTVSNLAGKGTVAAPYLISTGAELYAATVHTGAVEFKVINDIKLQSDANMQHLEALINNDTPLPTGVELNSWERDQVTFNGHLDGDYHIVTGLYISTTSAARVGFINTAGNGTVIKNLTFDKTYISAKKLMGGIVAFVSGQTTIDGCSVINSKLVNNCPVPAAGSTTDGQEAVGGIVGTIYHGTDYTHTISNCSILNTKLVQTYVPSDRLGGIWADTWDPSSGQKVHLNVSNCIVEGYVVTQKGTKYTNNYTNVYSTKSASTAADSTTVTVVEAKYLKGAELPGIDATTGWEIKDGEYPKYVGEKEQIKDSTVYWNGYKPAFEKAFAAQSAETNIGKETNPYRIYYGYQLYAAIHCDKDVSFRLMNNIQLQSNANMQHLEALVKNGTELPANVTLNNWTDNADTTFKGNFDGNFKTITGLYLYNTDETSGNAFIDHVAKSGTVVIKNLTIDGAYIYGTNQIGGIVGYHNGSTSSNLEVNGCVVKNSALQSTSSATSAGQRAVGGIVGVGTHSSKSTTIKNCASINNKLTNELSSACIGSVVGDFWSYPAVVENTISVGQYAPHKGDDIKSFKGVYATTLGPTAKDGSQAIKVSEQDLKDGNLNLLTAISPDIGWKLVPGELPVYTGEKKAFEPIPWDGTTKISYRDLLGSGTSDDPYKIRYGAELWAAVNSNVADVYFEMENDIKLQSDEAIQHLIAISKDSNPSPDTSTYEFNSWGKTSTFKGNLNGKKHTIYGLYTDATTYGNYGLFSELGGNATIEGVRIRGAYISTNGKSDENHVAGGIAGFLASGTNVNLIDCDVRYSTILAEDDVAGLIGASMSGNRNLNIDKCVVANNFIDSYQTAKEPAGFYAASWSASVAITVSNSISAGYVPIIYHSNINTSSYTNTYTTSKTASDPAGDGSAPTVLTSENIKGAEALPGIRPLAGWEFSEDEYPEFTGNVGAEITDGVTHWNGVKTNTLEVFEGNGTGDDANDPILIRHGFELYAAVQRNDGKYYKLVNDIYLNDVNQATSSWTNYWAVWKQGKTFSGTLDGDGHTVYGLHEPSSSGCDTNDSTIGVGLIPAVETATITNLHLRNVNMPNCWHSVGGAGGLVGAANTVKIEGCSVGGTFKNGFTRPVAGFVGSVTTSAEITDSVFVGGTIGKSHPDSTGHRASIIGDAGTATVTLTDVIANGYVFLGNGTATETNTFLVNVSGVGYSPAGVKYVLRSGKKSLSDAFYYDFLSENLPQLKNRKATQNVDIDGNAGTARDTNDALALKNILLYGGANQVNATDKTNYYNEVEGLDITDVVALYN